MALPKSEVPQYELVIPSSGQRVQYRPFLVKEEKILLLALRGEDQSQIITAMETIVQNCIMSPVDVAKLAMFDIEYIFLKIRSKSVGEKIQLNYICRNEKDVEKRDPDTGLPVTVKQACGTTVPVELDIDSVKVKTVDGHTNKIDFGNGIGVVMKYPNIDMVRKMVNEKRDLDDVANTLDIIAMCMESVYTPDVQTSEFTMAEAVEWLEGLTQQQFAKIQNFFDTIPHLKEVLLFKCPTCGHEQEIVLEGIQSFFG